MTRSRPVVLPGERRIGADPAVSTVPLVPSEPKSRELSTAAYTILGLLSVQGPRTIYELKGFIEVSIGNFWPFPHSQMYAETKRLEQAGLIDVEAETGGRGRRTLRITPTGRAALDDWWAALETPPAEIRDTGLLKLFLADPADHAGIVALAEQQQAAHRRRLEEYERLSNVLGDERGPSFATLRMGLSYERASIEFWASIAADAGVGSSVEADG